MECRFRSQTVVSTRYTRQSPHHTTRPGLVCLPERPHICTSRNHVCLHIKASVSVSRVYGTTTSPATANCRRMHAVSEASLSYPSAPCCRVHPSPPNIVLSSSRWPATSARICKRALPQWRACCLELVRWCRLCSRRVHCIPWWSCALHRERLCLAQLDS